MAIGAALAAVLCGGGCSTKMIEPRFDVSEHRIVIIPMREKVFQHFESRRGDALAELVTNHLAAKNAELGDEGAIRVVAWEDMVAAVQNIHEDPKDIAPEEIGRATQATLVLIGEIQEFSTRLRGDVALARGKAAVRVRAIDVVKPKAKPMVDEVVKVQFPEEKRLSTGILEPSEGVEGEIEAGLTTLLVRRIGEIFYAHPEEKADGAAARRGD